MAKLSRPADEFEIDYGVNAVRRKPPLGLKPKWIHESNRIAEIEAAVARYSTGGQEVPLEWAQELSELRGARVGTESTPRH